jgi:hypothetical protein
MGQQHRVRAKRKRRLAYLQRKKESTRASRETRPKKKSAPQSAAKE